jgi:hypothetical protein
MYESQASLYTVSQAIEDYGTPYADINNAKRVCFGVRQCLICSYDAFQQL